eukprot:TRINITY_DN2300_c0_g1_i1.p1 TRINITY_DN2300_c0_g1~~TRINITY_DN2300_c0_g1_i1.p1  ORF type:complete len:610 (+),score=137.38 TRINITY_DN2300_c0_g1_i1:67-1896(+)
MTPTWRQTAGDPSTYANISEVVVKHMSFDWRVDFDLKEIQGSAELSVEVLKDTDKVVLDSRDLKIHQVTVGSTAASHTAGEATEAFGSAVTVHAPVPLKAGTTTSIRITYQTEPQSTALAWLPAEQTDSGKHPYLFSQCQAIHARSLFPCQDTPGVRATYDAKVTVPKELRALMSALLDTTEVVGDSCVTTFKQPVAISSYLVALVVGNLEKRDISDRVAIWSEPQVVEAAAFDFSDTDKFVSAGEALVGPYEWTRYDVVCLPGSFPYGGMENPCLTFVTPSLLTGDKALCDVICHEVAHSWTGNLVGPKTWEDFYLNEGFTMFLQRKIMSRLYGEEYFDFDAIQGWDDLKNYMELVGKDHAYTVLRPNLEGVDPDDAFSVVPYEKGFNFICHLESVVGNKKWFEQWLHEYIQTFKHQAITTNDMVNHLVQFFSHEDHKADFSKVDFVAWLDTPGMPHAIPGFSSKLLDDAVDLAQRWKSVAEGTAKEVSENDIKGWSSSQICCFLTRVDFPMPVDSLTLMDTHYKFNSSKNCEVLFLWLKLCIRNNWTSHEPVLRSMLARIGRMKYTRPLYRELGKVDHEKAIAIFKENKQNYHSICQKMVGKDLGVE